MIVLGNIDLQTIDILRSDIEVSELDVLKGPTKNGLRAIGRLLRPKRRRQESSES